nr:PREDICTED: bcl10-interacting CARD protein isoform X1 [Equus przewalskii]
MAQGRRGPEQTYCDRLVQDTPFLTGPGRLSEQQVDRIILQLNRYYPQILSNKDAEKFRSPKASLRMRLCDLLGHLQRSGERDCQEFYRALYIHAQPLHSRLPSRHALTPCVSARLVPRPRPHPLGPSPETTSARVSSGPQREERVFGAAQVSLPVSLCVPVSPPLSRSLVPVFAQKAHHVHGALPLPSVTGAAGHPCTSDVSSSQLWVVPACVN